MAWLHDNFSRDSILAGISYALSSIFLTLINKYVFSRRSFHYPWFTLAFQNIISITIIYILSIFHRTTTKIKYQSKLSKQLIIPIIFFVLFIFSNAQALRCMNLPILTVFKSLGPIGITLCETFFFGDYFHQQVYYSMVLIILSAFVTAIYDLEFTTLGYFWAFLNVGANICYLISLRYYVSDKYNALEKTFHSNLLALIPILPISFYMNEFPMAFHALKHASFAFLFAYVMSGVLTLAICATAFWCITTCTCSSLSFIGGFNKIPIVILGAVLFETKISIPGWAGIVLGLFAGLVFVKCKAKGNLTMDKEITNRNALPITENSMDAIERAKLGQSNDSYADTQFETNVRTRTCVR